MSQPVTLSSLLSILSRRGLSATVVFIAAVVSAYAFARELPPQYEATSRLILDERQSSVTELGQQLSEQPEFGGTVNPLATLAELVTSQRVLELTHASLEAAGIADAVEQFPLKTVREKLNVSVLPATNILELTFTGDEPELTATFLNHLAGAIVAENIEATTSQATTVRQFLEDRLPKLQGRLNELEASERRYREQNGIVSLPEQTQNSIDSLAELQERERAVLIEIEEAGTRIASLKEVTKVNSLAQAYRSVEAGQDENLKQLKAQLTDLELRLIESRSRLGDRHPELLSLQDQVTALREQYSERLAEQLPGNAADAAAGRVPATAIAGSELSQDLISDLILSEVRLSALSKHRKRLQADQIEMEAAIAKLPQQQQFLARLSRQQQETSVSLEVLQRKLEEARIAEAQLVSLVRVIDEAVGPAEQSWPNLPVIFVLAAASGTILAAGTVVLLELLDDKVYDLEDIQALSGLPVLGSAPRVAAKKLSPVIARQLLDNQDYVETYRRIIKRIECSTRKSSNCIVISSIQTGKVESAFATSLAFVAAGLSRKTLLIDASLRQPAHHKLFMCLSAGPGTTDVINGDVDFDRAIQPTSIDNLSILPCGSPASNPAAIVESKEMKKLLEKAAAEFDWIVVSAPSSEWSDVMTLGQHSDGVALVADARTMLRSRLRTVSRELQGSNIPLLGVAVNSGKVRALQPIWNRKRPPNPPPYAALLAAESASTAPSASSSALSAPAAAYSSQSIDPRVLDDLSDAALAVRVVALERALNKIRPFVEDQEMELKLQDQNMAKLERSLQNANVANRSRIVEELEEESERYLLLEETLVGQRRTLKAREELLAQYKQALQQRKDAGNPSAGNAGSVGLGFNGNLV
ncbi:MAG: GNVR domain-containing protein [Cyanobacteria bacterium J06641_5]